MALHRMFAALEKLNATLTRFVGIAFSTIFWGCNLSMADNVPKLNVVPSCEAAAGNSVVAGRDTKACLADEQGAREELAKNWGQYRAADRQMCSTLVSKGGPASYVELLSCVQTMRDARSISKASDQNSEASDQATERAEQIQLLGGNLKELLNPNLPKGSAGGPLPNYFRNCEEPRPRFCPP